MRFGDVIQDLMAGGSKAVQREEWGGSVFLRYSELLDVFVLHGHNRETQLEELSLSPGDLFATDWALVTLDPRTGLPTR